MARAASKPIKELLRTEGPNYRRMSNIGHDQILGEERSRSAAEGAGRPAALATDHLVPLDRIANMPELGEFLKLYEKAPVALKPNMTADLVALGDRPNNLVRMNAAANGSALKGSKSWQDISYQDAKRFGYEPTDVDAMRLKEAASLNAIRQEGADLTARYRRIISDARNRADTAGPQEPTGSVQRVRVAESLQAKDLEEQQHKAEVEAAKQRARQRQAERETAEEEAREQPLEEKKRQRVNRNQ